MQIALISFDMALTQAQMDKLREDARRQMGRDYLVVALPRGVSITVVEAPNEYITGMAAGIQRFAEAADVLDAVVEPGVEPNEIVRRA